MSVSETIKKKLISEFKPQELEVIDESHLHAGHVGARPEGETHFRLVISSTNFIGKSRIDIQREIYKVLKDELNGPVHALTIKTCLLYTSPSPRDVEESRMPSSA